ncbi:hypothetical protein M378DRAFT_18467 [Amanita muscaria Koide BX008]|uniref:Uncharacterized protein n=1 Tax=Amanita muscaria (strain Koide BX008) TaxID=946122 RepID=A0A0C2RX34_AMAMK|nr:hypothetical protein M378DRAFT_18467 [Amanita muscaria Koide BX008]
MHELKHKLKKSAVVLFQGDSPKSVPLHRKEGKVNFRQDDTFRQQKPVSTKRTHNMMTKRRTISSPEVAILSKWGLSWCTDSLDGVASPSSDCTASYFGRVGQ